VIYHCYRFLDAFFALPTALFPAFFVAFPLAADLEVAGLLPEAEVFLVAAGLEVPFLRLFSTFL
jgi:hypothetical protein